MVISVMKDSLIQAGLININNLASSDKRLEQTIIEEEASYGRQLGYILDVMRILLKRCDIFDPAKLDEEKDQRAVAKLEELIRKVERKKYELRPQSVHPNNIHLVIEDIKMLQDDDRKKIIEKLHQEFPRA